MNPEKKKGPLAGEPDLNEEPGSDFDPAPVGSSVEDVARGLFDTILD